jgi:hypothetical protein
MTAAASLYYTETERAYVLYVQLAEGGPADALRRQQGVDARQQAGGPPSVSP